jgi:hypothetical protein
MDKLRWFTFYFDPRDTNTNTGTTYVYLGEEISCLSVTSCNIMHGNMWILGPRHAGKTLDEVPCCVKREQLTIVRWTLMDTRY